MSLFASFAHRLHVRKAARGSGRRYRASLFSYRTGCSNGAHRYNHDLAMADSNAWSGRWISESVCHFLGALLVPLGWSRDP